MFAIKTFVNGNQFGRFKSSLLSGEEAIVYAADPTDWGTSDNCPLLKYYRLKNRDRSLPLASFIDLSDESQNCELSGDTVEINDVRRKWVSHGDDRFDLVHSKQRVQTLLYKWLVSDIRSRFGTNKIHSVV